ncbi:MAG: DUF2516 family protein [Actinobacteria bacterium]|nr:DUF2516 family protein [Actinomycetota bacterium]
MAWLANLQFLLYWVLALSLFAVEAWALLDAAGRPAGAFLAAFKRTKTFWVALLAVMAVLGFLSLPISGLGLGTFGMMLAVVPAGIYLTDVRPNLPRRTSGRQ